MIEIEVAVLVALLVIIIVIIYKVRKGISKNAKPEINLKATVSAQQSQEIKPGDDPVFHAELKSKLPGEPKADESVFDTDPAVALQPNETEIPVSEIRNENLPQDSMLRRHYLANLLAMVESLKSPRPADSVLSRHYDAMIIAEMEQCLSNEATMEKLICNYEEHKKTLAQQIQKPEAIAEPLNEPIRAGVNHKKPKLPEDSMLRRHYLTHLRAFVESRMPPRPTDSTLRRHYDSMIENELKNLL